jgi:flagellar basal body-associated protein FliL
MAEETVSPPEIKQEPTPDQNPKDASGVGEVAPAVSSASAEGSVSTSGTPVAEKITSGGGVPGASLGTAASPAPGAAPGSAPSKKLALGKVLERAKRVPLLLLSLPVRAFRSVLSFELQSLAFIASLILLAWGLVQAYELLAEPKLRVYLEKRKQGSSHGEDLGDFIKAQKELAIASKNLVFLERFSGRLAPGPSKAALFEVEIAVELDEPATAGFVSGQLIPFKEVVSEALQSWKYEELMTEEGKEKLKGRIAEVLTDLLHKRRGSGEVKRVFFTRFVLAPS